MNASLKTRVTGSVTFVFLKDQALWYQTDDGWQFPVPLSDTDNATFFAQSKAITFMRWIRKHLDLEAQQQAEIEAARQDAGV